jgi:hypothetical protein
MEGFIHLRILMPHPIFHLRHMGEKPLDILDRYSLGMIRIEPLLTFMKVKILISLRFIPMGDFELPLYNTVGKFEAQLKVGFIGNLLDLNLMTGSTMVEEGSLGKPYLEGESKSKQIKCIKKILELVRLKLGIKTRLNDVMELEELVVIGLFPRREMSCNCFKHWKRFNFEPLVGYFTCIMTLEKGWLVWVFKLVKKFNKVLQSPWKWG